MAEIHPTRYSATEGPFGLGRRLYRIFLLSILFGVLWVKGYLWTAFVIALLLYLYDAIVIPALTVRPIEIAELEEEADKEVELPPKPSASPRRGRTRWKWKPEDSP
jgi:hypothetical protein